MDTEDEETSVPLIWSSNNINESCPPTAKVLVLEPFYGGSHKQLIDTLNDGL